MSTREYRYVGPAELAAQATAPIDRLAPRSPSEISAWLVARRSTSATFTFIVDPTGQLWLSDRGTEHVACAGGRHVLAAGEVTFQRKAGVVVVETITNQSTGYCPEPDCWTDAAKALRSVGLEPPLGFTHAFDFRRCTGCGTINVLKPELPECPACGAELPADWNFA